MALKYLVGRELDGACYNVTIGKTIIPFMSFGYGDNVTPEWIYEAGSQVPSAQTEGQYKPSEGKLKVRGVVFRGLIMPLMPVRGAANARSVAVVNFKLPDAGEDSDALYDFRILGPSGTTIEAGGKPNEVELSCSYRYIGWTSKRIQFGNPAGPGYRGAFKL